MKRGILEEQLNDFPQRKTTHCLHSLGVDGYIVTTIIRFLPTWTSKRRRGLPSLPSGWFYPEMVFPASSFSSFSTNPRF